MSDHSNIAWTDATLNPTLGCDKVSDGCRGCYAIVQAWIKQHHPNPKIAAAYAGLVEQRPDGSLNWTGVVRALPERLVLPLRWRSPRRIFVDSLSDLFHQDVPDRFIEALFGVMMLSPQHTYQVLTKRPQRMRDFLSRLDTRTLKRGAIDALLPGKLDTGINNISLLLPSEHQATMKALVDPVLPNVWLGVSVENQDAADNRIPLLLETPAAVRFLSCEPLLGYVQLGRAAACDVCHHGWRWHTRGGMCAGRGGQCHCSMITEPHVDWVIAGGESGPTARPMHPAWVRSLRAQCRSAGVPFFFKQWGNWMPGCDVHNEDPFNELMVAGVWDRHLVALERNGCIAQAENDPIRGNWCDYQPEPGAWWMANVGKKAAGRELDGREWSEYPSTAAASQ